MACVWQHPKSPFWIGQFTAPDGRRINRSTKQTHRRTAQQVVDTWEAAARKARLCELTQAASIKILSGLMEITTGEVLNVDCISAFFRGWLADREQLGRSDATMKRYEGVVGRFLAYVGEKYLNPTSFRFSSKVTVFPRPWFRKHSETKRLVRVWSSSQLTESNSTSTVISEYNMARPAVVS